MSFSNFIFLSFVSSKIFTPVNSSWHNFSKWYWCWALSTLYLLIRLLWGCVAWCFNILLLFVNATSYVEIPFFEICERVPTFIKQNNTESHQDPSLCAPSPQSLGWIVLYCIVPMDCNVVRRAKERVKEWVEERRKVVPHPARNNTSTRSAPWSTQNAVHKEPV